MFLLPLADCHCTDIVILNFVDSGMYLFIIMAFLFQLYRLWFKKINVGPFLKCNVYNVYIIYKFFLHQLFPISLESILYMIDTDLTSTIPYIAGEYFVIW